MQRQLDQAKYARHRPPINYAESDATPGSSPVTPSDWVEPLSSRTSVTVEDTGGAVSMDESEEDLDSDVIHVKPRSFVKRVLPQRPSRSNISYAKPTSRRRNQAIKQSKNGRRKVLMSNTGSSSFTVDKQPAKFETARAKLRQEISENTKPRRDAFILTNKQLFLPLLPHNNYITKLGNRGGVNAAEYHTYGVLPSQPKGIKAAMKPYQLEGLSFLVHMFQNGMSCVLGDEMGLGKTLQTLALFVWLVENDARSGGERQPHLVVCPLSVLSSWMRECARWTDLKAVRFHGPKGERDRIKGDLLAGADFDVLVTTYETFVAEAGWLKRAFAYRYCVLDEGHKIKNDATNVASSLQSLQAEYRLLLTGTPLQNNLKELWALLHWLLPDVFSTETATAFVDAFNLTQGKASTKFMGDARRLLELLMKRRMKSSPGVDLGLPPKTEVILYVPLTAMQRFWYTRLLTKVDGIMLEDVFRDAKVKVEQEIKVEDEATGAAFEFVHDSVRATPMAVKSEADDNDAKNSTQWKKLMNLIMQLRKVCSHPYLIPSVEPKPYYLGEHVKLASGKFIVLDKLVKRLVIQQKRKVLIFSGFTSTLDLCEDLLRLMGANGSTDSPFRYVRFDGSTGRARRNLSIRLFNDSISEFHIMLLSTRAGGLGINLASATEVILMDEDWNPQITLQAEARAHRIGQIHPVTVYKLCTVGTVEEQMMRRIRKKLYLSVKITESMRDIHRSSVTAGKKRKVAEIEETEEDDAAAQMGTDQLKALLRMGAQTLTHEPIDSAEMLDWDFESMLSKCKGGSADLDHTNSASASPDYINEEQWLNSIEKVECAVFEGRKLHRELDKEVKAQADLSRADRRVNKNTTVVVNGFAISKQSLQCAEWEAVPTLAGKDPRLSEPVRLKKAKIVHQDHCQVCWDGGEVVLCSNCPRTYHLACLDFEFKPRAAGKAPFFCPQHCCRDCGAKTADAGGMIYRCRWCERGYCEDCLDWDSAKLVSDSLPELEMLGFWAVSQAYYVECPGCMERWREDPVSEETVARERRWIEKEYERVSGKEAA